MDFKAAYGFEGVSECCVTIQAIKEPADPAFRKRACMSGEIRKRLQHFERDTAMDVDVQRVTEEMKKTKSGFL